MCETELTPKENQEKSKYKRLGYIAAALAGSIATMVVLAVIGTRNEETAMAMQSEQRDAFYDTLRGYGDDAFSTGYRLGYATGYSDNYFFKPPIFDENEDEDGYGGGSSGSNNDSDDPNCGCPSGWSRSKKDGHVIIRVPAPPCNEAIVPPCKEDGQN